MKSVLVTGATTPLGVAIVDHVLKTRGVKHVVAVGYEPSSAWTSQTVDDRVTYIRTNLMRSRSIRDLMFGPVKQHKVDTILHAALHRAASDTGPKIRKLNVESTRLMLRLAEDVGVKRFVFRSRAEVYMAKADSPTVIREDHGLNLSPRAPQWIRDRVEADLTVCAAMGLGNVSVAVLRCAEVFADNVGSQLWDYLDAPVCFRPVGYDPMLNLLSVADAARVLCLCAKSKEIGVFNIPGGDTLPLSEAIRRAGRPCVPVPGPLMGPLYRLRRATIKTDFRYDLNRWRFHFSALLDGERAKRVLGFEPEVPIHWPPPRR